MVCSTKEHPYWLQTAAGSILVVSMLLTLPAHALPTPKSPNAMTPSMTDVEEVGILAPSLPTKPTVAPAPAEQPPPASADTAGDAPLFPDEPAPTTPNDFLSFGYILRVVGTLAFLLGAFYLASKVLFKRSVHAQPSADWAESAALNASLSGSDDLAIPQANPQGILHQLFSRLHLSPSIQLAQRTQWLLTPRTLTRTRIGPGREILVMQVAQRLLVVAATPNSMSLLTELPMEILTESASTDTTSIHDTVAQPPDLLGTGTQDPIRGRQQPSRLNELIDKTVDKYLSPERPVVSAADYGDTYIPTRAAGMARPNFQDTQSPNTFQNAMDDALWDEDEAMNYAHSWTERATERYVGSTEQLSDYDDRY